MIRINRATGRKVTGVVVAITLATLIGGCARQESVITAQADTHTETIAQGDIPEVIVTASRDSATNGGAVRHE